MYVYSEQMSPADASSEVDQSKTVSSTTAESPNDLVSS